MNIGYFAEQNELTAKNRAYQIAGDRINPINDRLILSQPLANNTSKLILPILQDDTRGTSGITLNRRLNRNDLFVVSRIGFVVAKAASVGAVKNAAQFTYDNATGLDTATATDLKTVWNAGSLNWTIQNTDTFGFYPLAKHYRVPELQANQVISTDGQAAGTTYPVAIDAQNYGDIMLPVFPLNMEIDGGVKNEFSIQMPDGLTVAPGSGANYAILIFDGYLVQGAATGA